MIRPTRRAEADDARCDCDDGAAQDCLGLSKPGPDPWILSHQLGGVVCSSAVPFLELMSMAGEERDDHHV